MNRPALLPRPSTGRGRGVRGEMVPLACGFSRFMESPDAFLGAYWDHETVLARSAGFSLSEAPRSPKGGTTNRARFMGSPDANFSAHCGHEPLCASPSPLNGERAGVRGEKVPLACSLQRSIMESLNRSKIARWDDEPPIALFSLSSPKGGEGRGEEGRS